MSFLATLRRSLRARSRQERLRLALYWSGRMARPLEGCLGCALLADLAGRLPLTDSETELELLVREAASYATSASLAGCLSCGGALDALCEAGLYSQGRSW